MRSSPAYPILLQPSGAAFTAGPGETLLAAAERAGIAMPSSCRNGSCRTCLRKVVEGKARHLVDWPGLSAEEKRDGYILPCVAVAESALVLAAP
ncbi:2Fe-2S iron-sulfur cluster-binding protein [Massilia sp. GCM10020059]|uniref:2Fe-2S iron-sulfur cluster-binding protein n=1 Tax=Massilia agrisoli TaxID=2892444 RepID=A0ABS8IY79_9BURK|nr:2Fe-2S iron-sulfur cluster-binding protein [Massilia agrisoli]MCC6072946.1 2Fe-2S iron-sulfur cluster-binding protein [Massilia agrisoli]